MEQITIENYEEYLVMHADGELQPHQEEMLMTFLKENPHLERELTQYAQARLTPDPLEVYTLKKMLLKELPNRKISIPYLRIYAIAASVAAIAFFTVLALRNNNLLNTNVATNNHFNTPQLSQPGKIVPPTVDTVAALQPPNVPAASIKDGISDTNAAAQQSSQVAQCTIQPYPGKTSARKARRFQPPPARSIGFKSDEALAHNTQLQISRLPVASLQMLPVMAPQLDTLPPEAITQFVFDDGVDRDNGNWLDRLPITDEKKQHLTTIGAAIANGIEKVQTLQENIKEKSVSVKIQQRKFILSF